MKLTLQALGYTLGPTLEKKRSLRVSAPAITVNQWTTQFKLCYCRRNCSASDTSALIKLHHSLEGGSFMPGAVLCSSLEFWQLQYHKHLEGITAHRLQWERSVLWMRFDIYISPLVIQAVFHFASALLNCRNVCRRWHTTAAVGLVQLQIIAASATSRISVLQ